MSEVKKLYKKFLEFINNRSLMLYIIVVIVAVIYIVQLFNLQIINGKEYREKSEKRMLRTENITAPRGEIYDRNGVVLATSKLSYNIELYKVKIDAKEQNLALSKLVNILYSNNDSIYSSFPINDNLDGFNFSDLEEEKKWKNEMNIKEEYSFEQVIDYYIRLYGLEEYESNPIMQKRIIQIKYEANLNGYSLFNSCVIAKDISEKSLAQIEEKKYELYGVNTVSVPSRYYPNGTLLAHVIGYVRKVSNEEYKTLKDSGYTVNSMVGKSGIEQSFEKYLKGKDGVKKVETDSLGNISSETITNEAQSGDSISLTIDYRLQKKAEEALLSCIKGLQNGTIAGGKKITDANAGAVVVLDVNSGELLASASYPTYDINLFTKGISNADWKKLSTDALKPMYNRCISGTYSPGSTYKMLVGIAGLKNGAIKVDEKYFDPGVYPYGHKPKCWLYSYRGTTHGWIDISGAIKGSCNCYFYEVGRRIGVDEIVKYTRLFGLGQKTGIELPGEAEGTIAGANKNNDTWYLGNTLSASIGQGDNQYTPIQLANYISAIANGGKLNKVSVIKEVKNEKQNSSVSLEEISKYSSEYTGVNFEERNLDIDEKYLKAIKEGMLSVTSDTGGTANIVFKNSNIQVAGKTGTSQVPGGRNNGIFVGFAPYDNPKIAVVAVIEHGDEGTYTANVVKPIMEEYFNILTENKENEKVQNVTKQNVEF